MNDRQHTSEDSGSARKVALLLELAEELRRDGKLEETKGALEQAVAIDSFDERALYELATAHGETGNNREAIRLLRRGLSRKRLVARALYLSALAKEVAEAGRPLAALQHAKAAAALEPTVAEYHRRVGQILTMLGRVKDAVAPLSRAVKLDPERSDCRRSLASALLQAGRADESIPQYIELLKRVPKDYIARAELAEAYSAIGKYIRASKQARLASRSCPDDFQSHYDLGTVFGLSGAGEFAILHLKRAVSLNPESAQAWSNLSAALLDCGEERTALRTARRALQIAPDDPRAWCNLGEACGFLDRFEEAIDAFERAVALDARHETNARDRLRYARTMLRKAHRPSTPGSVPRGKPRE